MVNFKKEDNKMSEKEMKKMKKPKVRMMAITAFLALVMSMILTTFANAATIGTSLTVGSLPLAAILIAVLGLILVIVALFIYTSSRMRISIGITGAILLILGLVIFATPMTPTNNQIVTSNAPSITISQVTATGYTYTASTNTILVPITVNATAKTITSPTGGVVAFSFTVMRTDTNTSAAVFKLTSSWSSLTNTTTQVTSPVVALATNGTSEIHYNGIWGGTALFSVPSAGSLTISASITLNAAAILDLKQYGSTDVYVSIGGQTLNVELLLSN
jgi:hypothetical protein